MKLNSKITSVTLSFPDGISMEQSQDIVRLAELSTASGCSEGGYVSENWHKADGEMKFSETDVSWVFKALPGRYDDSLYNRKEFESWWFKLCHVDHPCFYRDILRALKLTLWAQFKRESYRVWQAEFKQLEENNVK